VGGGGGGQRADSTRLFHEFTGRLYAMTSAARPTAGHHFLDHLRAGRRLLRVYTQNIDGLEEEAGLRLHALDGRPSNAASGRDSEGEVVQLHGDLRWLRCGLCHEKVRFALHRASYERGEPVACPACRAAAQERYVWGPPPSQSPASVFVRRRG
jgi:NAD+-dependent protein deacetylase SIR2